MYFIPEQSRQAWVIEHADRPDWYLREIEIVQGGLNCKWTSKLMMAEHCHEKPDEHTMKDTLLRKHNIKEIAVIATIFGTFVELV